MSVRTSLRRSLSEGVLERETTFEASLNTREEDDIPQSYAKRRRLYENPLGKRSISEVLPVVAKSLESDFSDAVLPLTAPVEATKEDEDEAPRESSHSETTNNAMPPLINIPALPNETEAERNERSRCVYIDRISIDVTDAMIKQAIDDHLLPQGVKKVQSLEVIRTQKSRHVHAFAILTQTMAEEGILDVPVACGEYIKVQRAVKQLQLPPPPKVCRTLHIRIYARRSGWSEAVRRMTWKGLLCILEFVSTNVTDKITMIADDRSSRSVASHSDNMCCVFFAECASEEDARAVHEAVHDKTTRGFDDVVFLVRTDYAKGEKKLHDTSVNLDQLRQKYNDAKDYARTAAGFRGPSWEPCSEHECPIPEGLRKQQHKMGVHECFEFATKNASARKKAKRGKDSGSRSPKKETSPCKELDNGQPSVSGGEAHFMLARDPSQIHLGFQGGEQNPWDFGRTSEHQQPHNSHASWNNTPTPSSQPLAASAAHACYFDPHVQYDSSSYTHQPSSNSLY